MASRNMINGVQGRNEKNFLADRNGNIAILFALFLVPVIMLMGLAIDGLRALNAAETTADALDAAALAAARAMTEGGLSDTEVKAVAKNYFQANTRGQGKVGYSTYADLEVTPNRDRNQVTVAVNTNVATTFSRIAHIDKFSLRREATATMGITEIELGLMLDVTGSMNRNGKLRALKNATKDLIRAVVPKGRNANRVRIALAPYSEQVNVGRYADIVSDARNRSGCVVGRQSGDFNSDNAPSPGNGFHVMTRQEKREYDRGRCPDAEILPLTSNKHQLERVVDGYRAEGWTAGHLGIQWAWNLVSPKWSRIWSRGSKPKPYGTPNLIKAVVLMTDGEFNTAYTGRTSRGEMSRESYAHTGELCRKMKDEDVVIFSVAFDLRQPRAEDALSDCASSSRFFYRAENEEELRRAYRDIAIKLTKLRLSK